MTPFTILAGSDGKAIAGTTVTSFTTVGASAVRLFSDRAIHVTIDGSDPTVDSMPIPADTAEIITGITSGAVVKALLVTGETDGTVWLTPVGFNR